MTINSLKSKENKPIPSRLGSKEEVIKECIILPLFEAYRYLKASGTITVGTHENIISNKIIYNVKNKSSISELYEKHYIEITLRPKEHHTEEALVEPDIEFTVFAQCKLWIEAKRIYQNDSISNYCGKGGLEDYLIGRYSDKEDNGGMLAYIQSGSLHEIQNEIIETIRASNCREIIEDFGIDDMFVSIHEREKHGEINMFHLFFDFLTKSGKY